MEAKWSWGWWRGWPMANEEVDMPTKKYRIFQRMWDIIAFEDRLPEMLKKPWLVDSTRPVFTCPHSNETAMHHERERTLREGLTFINIYFLLFLHEPTLSTTYIYIYIYLYIASITNCTYIAAVVKSWVDNCAWCWIIETSRRTRNVNNDMKIIRQIWFRGFVMTHDLYRWKHQHPPNLPPPVHNTTMC